MEMIRRIRYAYENLPNWLKPGITDDGWNMHTIAFDNESRIDSTAPSMDAGRGESLSLLFLDEFAFVKRNIQEEFWTSILPTLSTGGSCIMSSTPNGDADLFATLWRAAMVNKPYVGEDSTQFEINENVNVPISSANQSDNNTSMTHSAENTNITPQQKVKLTLAF